MVLKSNNQIAFPCVCQASKKDGLLALELLLRCSNNKHSLLTNSRKNESVLQSGETAGTGGVEARAERLSWEQKTTRVCPTVALMLADRWGCHGGGCVSPTFAGVWYWKLVCDAGLQLGGGVHLGQTLHFSFFPIAYMWCAYVTCGLCLSS